VCTCKGRPGHGTEQGCDPRGWCLAKANLSFACFLRGINKEKTKKPKLIIIFYFLFFKRWKQKAEK
jgi:hypothetical protein